MASTSMVFLALILTPVVYVFLQIIKFLQSVRRRKQAVVNWPGLPIHWLYGNFHQHPLWKNDARNNSNSGEVTMAFLRGMAEKFPKGYYFIYGPFQPALVAVHPDAVRAIMKSHDPKPMTPGSIGYNYLLPWLGEGLLTAKGKRWARNRRLLTPAFHFDILKPYMPVYNEATDILLEKMERYKDSDEGFCVTENISLCTLDILLRCVFSQQTNCQDQGDKHPYVAAVQSMSLAIFERIFHLHHTFNWVYLNLSSQGRKFSKDCQFVHKVSYDVISKRRKELEKGTAAQSDRKYLDFLDILLSAHDEDGIGLTDLEIRSEVDTFLFEGHDTTASGLTWMLYSLAKHPEHQKKAQQEIDTIMDAKGSDVIEWDDLPHLKHLTLCMKEALRMYPPVSFISRKLEKDLEVDGNILPAGLHVDVLIYSLHHNPEIWEDHMEFIPERFLPENIQKKDAFAYIPFSAGPRNCIGQNFAMNEEKVILARILRKYDLELDPTHEVKFSVELILKALDDVKLLVKARKN